MLRPTLLLALCSLALAGPPAGSARLTGFSAAGAQAQLDLERRFDAQLDPGLLKDWMQRLTAHPHHVGSPWNKANVDWLVGQFQAWGFQTRVETFQVLFPTPKLRVLELLGPRPFKAALQEPEVPGDRTSGQGAEQLPPYNAYSIDGDVTGELVYANQGLPRDYEALAARGIDVKGRIVLVRYGGSWRGIKPKVAAEHGALGCIIYSDPAQDGYTQGEVWPKGGWRSAKAVQRGSVMDIPLYPGDPLTPGVAAVDGAKRLPLAEAATLTRIPVLPISYADAQPLLEALAGPMAPEGWRGALPIPYHLGPGPAKVHLAVSFDWSLKPVRDVIAVLPGADPEGAWIIRGQHQDAWVNGAADPVSGLVAELAEARSVGMLVKGGFRPQRTLVYAVWDGEEAGLLGSTEWVELHQADLLEKTAIYINSDFNTRGFLFAEGSPSLERMVGEVADDIMDPERGVSLWERTRASLIIDGSHDQARQAKDSKALRLEALGSGSDYSAFLQHAGIASLNLGFSGEEKYGQYHSSYDSFDHYLRFGDPGFKYGVALAKVGGRVTLRFAQAQRLPFALGPAADRIHAFLEDLQKDLDGMRKDSKDHDQDLQERWGLLAADPEETYVAPLPKGPVPFLNFAPLQNAVERLQKAAQSFDEALAAAEAAPGSLGPAKARALETRLSTFERTLTNPDGLPGRPWYVHEIYAPGRYTGYGPKTLPAVREAIEARDWPLAETQVVVVARILDNATRVLVEARALLE